MSRLAWGKKWYVLQNFWDLSEKWIFETEYCFNLLVEASTDLAFAPISDFNMIYFLLKEMKNQVKQQQQKLHLVLLKNKFQSNPTMF